MENIFGKHNKVVRVFDKGNRTTKMYAKQMAFNIEIAHEQNIKTVTITEKLHYIVTGYKEYLHII